MAVQSKDIKRRDALRVIGAGTCALAAVSAGCTFSEIYSDFEGEAVEVDLSTPAFEALQNIGEMVPLEVGPVKLNLIRTDAETLVAIDRICPHLGEDMAPIGSSPTARGLFMENQLWCTAHGSQFDLDGEPVGGPSTAGIQTFEVDFTPSENGGSAIVYVGVARPSSPNDGQEG